MKTSIIIAAYNSERFLEKCLQSITAELTEERELIVVDDGSVDATAKIAKKFATKIIQNKHNCGTSRARNEGMRQAKGEVLVFIDSDIVIQHDTISLIEKHFQNHPNVTALTGLLSKEHPGRGFFTQYKNLYMHHIFCGLPEEVNFLYGSVHALRREGKYSYDEKHHRGEDTALGQKIYAEKGRISFLRHLEVEHLKEHNIFSFVKNDFLIPYNWAKVFMCYKGWKQLGYNGTGYAHASKKQLASILIAPLTLANAIMMNNSGMIFFIEIIGVVVWGVLNIKFFVFLEKERGMRFAFFSVIVTFFDHIVMASGVMAGFIASLLKSVINRRSG